MLRGIGSRVGIAETATHRSAHRSGRNMSELSNLKSRALRAHCPSRYLIAVLCISIAALFPRFLSAAPVWAGYAGDAQHAAISTIASQSLQAIHWQTSVDLYPQFTNGDLLI